MKKKLKARRPTPSREMLAITPKQAQFVAFYLADPSLNATEAARRAGYSAPDVQGPRLRKKPQISAAIAVEMERRAARTEITQDRVLKELASLAFSNINHYEIDNKNDVVLAPGAPPHAMAAIESVKRKVSEWGVTVEIKLWDKPGMLKLAGRHVDVHGFADRVELTGKNGEDLPAPIFYLPENGRRKAD